MGKSEKEKDEEGKEEQVVVDIPLKSISYDARVTGITAKVSCTQKFQNKGNKSVEAIYCFPLPESSSIIDCEMKIGQRKVKAVLKKREEARQQYDDAVAAGHHASLLEQERPNIFTMNVGGIEPGEEVDVKINYVQPVPWGVDGARFSIPLVVAPRFIPGVAAGKTGKGWAEDTDKVPDASKITPNVAREGVDYTAQIKLSLSPGFDCEISSPSHPDIIKKQEVESEEQSEFETGEIKTDRDFVLVYQPTAKVPQVAVHTGAFEKEKFLLLNIIPQTRTGRMEARDIGLLLDISGSMDGPKIAGLKTFASKLLGLIQESKGWKVGVIEFNNDPKIIAPLGEVDDKMIASVKAIESGGGTELGKALTCAYEMLSKGRNADKYIVLVTDGQTEATVHTGTGARIVSIGIDSAINDDLLKDIARRTGGVNLNFLPGEDFDIASRKAFGTLSGPVITGLEIEGDVVGLSDVFEGMPATIVVRYKNKIPDAVTIEGKGCDGNNKTLDIDTTVTSECSFAPQIWAREKIRETREEAKATEISLKYGVISQYTSFVAISEKEVPGQKPERVEIPVNLPQGWTFEKIFGGGLARGGGAAMHCFSSMKGGGSHRLFDAGIGASVDMSMADERQESLLAEFGDSELGASIGEVTRGVEFFNLEALECWNTVIGILIALEEGRTQEAEDAWTKMMFRISAKDIVGWEDENKARFLYFCLRLRQYAAFFSLPEDIMQVLSKKPADVCGWWVLVMKEMGKPYKQISFTPVDGHDYIMWKLGRAHKPIEEPWSLVP